MQIIGEKFYTNPALAVSILIKQQPETAMQNLSAKILAFSG
ncbi:MAG: hypothetical protein ACREFE_02710 [Limisphaerales bacterium]